MYAYARCIILHANIIFILTIILSYSEKLQCTAKVDYKIWHNCNLNNFMQCVL